MNSETRIFKFDKEGNLISTRLVREPEAKIWNEGETFKYSVSQGGKILHGGVLGEFSICPYCHEEIETEPKKVGALNFHYACYLKFISWQRRNEC